MVPDNEIVVTKLKNKFNFISNFFVLMHFTGQKKKSIGVIHSVLRTWTPLIKTEQTRDYKLIRYLSFIAMLLMADAVLELVCVIST